MLRLELLGLLLLACTHILTEHRNFHESRSQYIHYPQRYGGFEEKKTRDVRVKEGQVRGMVVRPKTNYNLQMVDVFLGVPYAEPPVGSFRFSPPRSPQPWRGVRNSLEFAPVCPQVLPNPKEEMKPGRYEYVERHLLYLKNQSEDCLYLNIYAPHQAETQRNLRKYPVMVFIHSESYEWSSGNLYDGTMLASYGNIVFVTINFRLGILGFLRPGIKDDSASNFGLLDQIAALLWLRENIAEFGGDPNSVTLVGHGTGAIFANLLLISPVADKKVIGDEQRSHTEITISEATGDNRGINWTNQSERDRHTRICIKRNTPLLHGGDNVRCALEHVIHWSLKNSPN